MEEVARLAGMEPSEWLAVEAGRVPETAAQLRLMAAALQFSKVQLATVGPDLPGRLGGIALLCRRPGPSGALAAGTHNPICSSPEEGGETNQDEGRNRVKALEHQYHQKSFTAASSPRPQRRAWK